MDDLELPEIFQKASRGFRNVLRTFLEVLGDVPKGVRCISNR